MTVDERRTSGPPRPDTPAAAARRLLRTALKGSLATLDRDTGHPYASLVLLATEPDGAPIFLISRLALHTRNLEVDARASLLVDGTGALADPLTGDRLTVTGEARPAGGSTALRRFLARHPQAAGYAQFADFAVYRLAMARGHYVGGFGRIVDLDGAALTTDLSGAEDLREAEPGILEHMNADHADAVALYATVLAGQQPGAWRLSGIDPDGADLLHCTTAARLEFPDRVLTAKGARDMLVALVRQARAQKQSNAQH
jgi:putative heme iron utilization protein